MARTSERLTGLCWPTIDWNDVRLQLQALAGIVGIVNFAAKKGALCSWSIGLLTEVMGAGSFSIIVDPTGAVSPSSDKEWEPGRW